jgi:Ca2+-binding RTX toxin-like protein
MVVALIGNVSSGPAAGTGSAPPASATAASSFDTSATQRLTNDLYPAAGIHTSIDYVGYSFSIANLSNIATWADSISVNTPYLTPALVTAAHEAGLKVYAWTHNSTGAELQSLIDMGVDGVYTDNTGVAREYVDSVAGIETVYGSTDGGIVSGTDGDNVVYGLQGDDIILGSAGDDVLNGDGGNDILVAGAGNNLLRGGIGTDVLFGGTGSNTLAGGVGNDVIVSGGTDTRHYALGDRIDLVEMGAGGTVIWTASLPPAPP